MKLNKMPKEELETLAYSDLTEMILKEKKKAINTPTLFKEICKLLELTDDDYANQIGDYYTSLTTDKRFILLDNGKWDLRKRHTSDKVIKVSTDDEEEEEIENEESSSQMEEEIEEDNYDDTDESDYDDDTNEELKDLVVIDEDELELEE